MRTGYGMLDGPPVLISGRSKSNPEASSPLLASHSLIILSGVFSILPLVSSQQLYDLILHASILMSS